MIKIEKVKDSEGSNFSFYTEELSHCMAFRITFFGKTFRIIFSKKFDYFLIARKTIKNEKAITNTKVLLGDLASFILEQALEKEGLHVHNLNSLLTYGVSPTFNFRGELDGKSVFIKLHISSSNTQNRPSFLRTEYENGTLFSSICPYGLKPITYLELPRLEILITPFVENALTLHDAIHNGKDLQEEYFIQIQEAKEYMNKNYLAHGDLHANNILIGTINGDTKRKIYIIDLYNAEQFTRDTYFNSSKYKSDERNFNSLLHDIYQKKHKSCIKTI